MFSFLLKTGLWGVLTTLVFAAVYIAYWFLWVPLSKRRYFSKFPSVAMNPQFKFLFGDFGVINEEYGAKNKFMGLYFKDVALKDKGYPFYYFYAGMMDGLTINDPAYFKEFIDFVPSHVDREPIDNSGFGRVGGTGGIS